MTKIVPIKRTSEEPVPLQKTGKVVLFFKKAAAENPVLKPRLVGEELRQWQYTEQKRMLAENLAKMGSPLPNEVWAKQYQTARYTSTEARTVAEQARMQERRGSAFHLA